MNYLLLWLFGFPICLMTKYYTGEIDNLSTKDEILSGWYFCVLWPIFVPIVLVINGAVFLHKQLIKLNPTQED